MVMLGWVVGGLLGLAVGAQLGVRRANGSAARRIGMREVVHDLEAQVGRLGVVERFVLAKLLRREAVSRDPAERQAEMEIIGLHAKLDDLLGQIASRLPQA